MKSAFVFDFEEQLETTPSCCATKKQKIMIEDDDFDARFDGKRWVVKWKWSNGHNDMKLSYIPNYHVKENLRGKFETEIED